MWSKFRLLVIIFFFFSLPLMFTCNQGNENEVPVTLSWNSGSQNSQLSGQGSFATCHFQKCLPLTQEAKSWTIWVLLVNYLLHYIHSTRIVPDPSTCPEVTGTFCGMKQQHFCPEKNMIDSSFETHPLAVLFQMSVYHEEEKEKCVVSFTVVVVCFSVAVIKQWAKPTSYNAQVTIHHFRKSGQEFNTRTWRPDQRNWTEAENREEHCSSTGLLSLSCLATFLR